MLPQLDRKWHLGLDFDEDELKEEVVEEMVQAEEPETESSLAVTSEHVTRSAAADQLTHSEQEESKTFVITGMSSDE